MGVQLTQHICVCLDGLLVKVNARVSCGAMVFHSFDGASEQHPPPLPPSPGRKGVGK